MSTTDQAFIRAYQQDVAVGSVTLTFRKPPQAATQPEPATLKLQQYTLSDVLEGQESAAKTNHDAIDTSGQQAGPLEGWGQIATVHVGLGSVVPPPHANFGGIESGRAKRLLGQSPKASLSSFVEQIVASSAAVDPFKPALEIDAVRWPAVCETLLTRHAERFQQLKEELCREAEAGKQVIALTGVDRNEGRTTLALCLAKLMAGTGLKLALVDADFDNSQLAGRLGIEVPHGWEATLTDDTPLADVMIDSIGDRFAIVPLGVKASSDVIASNDSASSMRGIPTAIDELKNHYDLILLDAGPLGDGSKTSRWLLDKSTNVDGVIVTHDLRRGSASRLAAACLRLADAGKPQLGIAEMFATEA